jgi:hypothetical protein
MNVDDNAGRLLSTVSIWIATAVIFVFGFFRMNVSGEGMFLWFLIGVALAVGPVIATKAIWKSQTPAKPGSAKPGNSGNA